MKWGKVQLSDIRYSVEPYSLVWEVFISEMGKKYNSVTLDIVLSHTV